MVNRNLNFFLFLLFISALVFFLELEVYADPVNSNPAVSKQATGLDKAVPKEDKYNKMVIVPAGVFRRGSTSDNVTRFYEMCRKADKKCKRW